jgi:hypothetical protein
MSINLLRDKTGISTAIIALIIIVVAVAVAGGAYYVMTQNNPSSPSNSESPTPSTTPNKSTSPTLSPSSTETTGPTSASPTSKVSVASATSLQYSVNQTETLVGQKSYAYTFSGKNAGTPNFMMRIDATDDQGNKTTFIVNGADQTAWSYSNSQWTNLTSTYAVQLGIWNPLWQGYVNELSAWSGSGDFNYTQTFTTIRIYDISINPALPDSLFQHG